MLEGGLLAEAVSADWMAGDEFSAPPEIDDDD
jgi:hypothetical protein